MLLICISTFRNQRRQGSPQPELSVPPCSSFGFPSSSSIPLRPSIVRYRLRLALSSVPVIPAPTPDNMPTSLALNPPMPPSSPPTHLTPSLSNTLPSTLAPNSNSFCNPLAHPAHNNPDWLYVSALETAALWVPGWSVLQRDARAIRLGSSGLQVDLTEGARVDASTYAGGWRCKRSRKERVCKSRRSDQGSGLGAERRMASRDW